MVDFISEVQEELRKDDYNRWLKRYGPYAIAGIVAVVAAAGFYEWSKARTAKEARVTSQSYIAASETAETGDAENAIREYMAISQTAPSGYAGLALMRSAELELDKGNSVKAVELLEQAAAKFELPRHQQLAQIKAVYILAGNGEYAKVLERATPLAEKGEPYEFLARELVGFAAKELGDLSKAREQFSYLDTIPGVPGSIKQRAKQYLDLMSVASAKSLPDLPADTPVDETGVPSGAEDTSGATETNDESE